MRATGERRAGTGGAAPAEARGAGTAPPRAGLPAPATPFVGREADLAEIAGLLATPACRLLTLIGPGGIGKTRLALRVARELTSSELLVPRSELAGGAGAGTGDLDAATGAGFSDGAHFVPLQPLASPDLLAPAIADVLGLPRSGARDPREQVLDFMRDRALLLVLDNFEHLLEGAGLLAEILAAAPGVKLLVTSREALSLQEEWRYPVQGLPYPEREDGPDLERHAAVRLFAERARRVRRDFSLAEEGAAVAHICRLVEGMPLALELAAAWTDALPCAEIAAGLAPGLEVLSARLRDVPERHRSMQAVFDQSWARLSEAERAVFRRLAVFRGGFRREAAHAIAGASARTLSALVDRSLLRLGPDGRYHLHELLRQYAEARLSESPEEAHHARAAHAAYYVEFIESRLEAMLGAGQRAARLELREETDNVRGAWEWAAARADAGALRRAAPTLAVLHDRSGSYHEGAAAFEAAARALAAPPSGDGDEAVLLARLVVEQQLGRFHMRLGRIDAAGEALAKADALHERLGRPAVPGAATDPRLGLAQIAVIRGAYPAALALAEAALPAAVAGGHLHNQQAAWELLARTAMHLGRLDEAQRDAEQSQALAEASGDRWALAHALHMLGNLADIRHDYARARAHFEACLAILEELDDPSRAGVARNKLGLVALHQGQPAAAQRHFQHSRAVFEQNGDRSGLIAALEGLGNAAAAQGDYATARECFREALRQLRAAATDGAYGIYLASLLASVGELAGRAGEPGRGRELLDLAARHPAATQYMRERTQHLLGTPPSGDPCLPLPDDQALVTLTLEVLAALETATASAPEAQRLVPGGAPLQSQVEPLSARELEVLRLLADGLSNQEIAARLFVTVGTVKTHVHNVCGKLGAPTRGRAVAAARELGLLTPAAR